MSAITIGKELHHQAVKELRNEYVHEFGFDSVMNISENVKKFTRTEYASTYAKNILFWKTRIPNIDPDNGIDMKLVAKHAVCTNAVQNLMRQVEKMNLKTEVEELLS